MKLSRNGASTTTIGLAVVLVIVIIAAGAYIALNPSGKVSTTTATATVSKTSTATATTTATATSTYYTSSGETTNTALSGTLLETGSSLLYPAFQLWVANFSQYYPHLQVTPASTGSGTGQADAEDGTVQVGGSDAYMTPAELSEYSTMLNIPLAISAQQVNYNIPGLNTVHLNMSGTVLAEIYNGTITMWNDSRIASLQSPSVASKLPGDTIIPVRRGDSSGDTFLFTSFLSDTNAWWNKTVGYATSVQWPAVPGELSPSLNSGMLDALQTPYTIAYVGISYLNSANQLGYGNVYLQNKAGNFVGITSTNIESAVSALAPSTPANEIISLINAPGADSYPIVNYEYAIVNMHQSSAATAQNIQAFLTWIVTYGNAPYFLLQVHFEPLPASVQQLSLTQIDSITSP